MTSRGRQNGHACAKKTFSGKTSERQCSIATMVANTVRNNSVRNTCATIALNHNYEHTDANRAKHDVLMTLNYDDDAYHITTELT